MAAMESGNSKRSSFLKTGAIAPSRFHMAHFRLRVVRDDDWPAILAVANRSVAGVAGAGPQDEWLRNRQRFDPAGGWREQWFEQSYSSPS